MPGSDYVTMGLKMLKLNEPPKEPVVIFRVLSSTQQAACFEVLR
jgi:hypothetical protein